MKIRTAAAVAAALIAAGCATSQDVLRNDFSDKGFGVSIVSRVDTDMWGGTSYSLYALSTDHRNLCLIMWGSSKYLVPAGSQVRLGAASVPGGTMEVFTDLSRCR